MKTIFLTCILVVGIFSSILPGNGFAQIAAGSVQATDEYFFSSGGMVNTEYRIFDRGVSWFINSCHKNYKVGESCPVSDEYARKIFKIKPGMLVKVFKDSVPVCSGKIEGFSYIAYESIDGFFLNSNCKADGLMVIASSEKLLKKAGPGSKSQKVNDQKVIDVQAKKVLAYYSTKLPELQSLLAGYKRDNPDLSDAELPNLLLEKFNFAVESIQSPKLFLISGEEKEVRWGARFMFLGAADGPLAFLGESRLIQQLRINGVPYLYLNSQQQGTGITVFKLAKLSGASLETVFTEGGFSD